MAFEGTIYDCSLYTAVMVGFESRIYAVGDRDGQVELCVNITVPRRQDIGTVTFNLNVETQDGSAGIANNRRSKHYWLIGGIQIEKQNYIK